MLSVPPTVSIFLYTRVADLRKGFDGLAGIVRQEFDADPLDGSLFLFVNRRRFPIRWFAPISTDAAHDLGDLNGVVW